MVVERLSLFQDTSHQYRVLQLRQMESLLSLLKRYISSDKTLESYYLGSNWNGESVELEHWKCCCCCERFETRC